MSKVLACMQPTYLPWMGFFDLIYRSDIFVIYDTAQFSKASWHQRNRIRNRNREQFLCLPVVNSGKLGQKLNEVEILNPAQICRKHLRTIEVNYAKSRNFSLLFPRLEEIYMKKQNQLIDLNVDLIRLGVELFEIKTPIHFTNEAVIMSKKTDAVLEICSHFGADVCHVPVGSKVYIGEGEAFAENGIKLVYQKFSPPVYPQMDYRDFMPSLSFIDYIFNVEDFRFFRYSTEL